MSERYYIDQRAGCIAVRDRRGDNDNEPGLHPETTGVVKYWGGTPKSRVCEHCKSRLSDGWDIPEAAIAAAVRLRDRLNGEPTKEKL